MDEPGNLTRLPDLMAIDGICTPATRTRKRSSYIIHHHHVLHRLQFLLGLLAFRARCQRRAQNLRQAVDGVISCKHSSTWAIPQISSHSLIAPAWLLPIMTDHALGHRHLSVKSFLTVLFELGCCRHFGPLASNGVPKRRLQVNVTWLGGGSLSIAYDF